MSCGKVSTAPMHVILASFIALVVIVVFAASIPKAHAASASAIIGTTTTSTGKTITKSAETYGKSTLTKDSDGFFASLSADGNASFATKIKLADLEKIGISFSKGSHVAKSGKGSCNSPVYYGSTRGANVAYAHLYTITIDNAVFKQAAKLTYINNNGEAVAYNKRDVIQAVLYAIGNTTQAKHFDGSIMYQVHINYPGTINLTNGLFIYRNTWLKLEKKTVLKKQFQSAIVPSSLASRTDAKKRRINFTNQNLLRTTADEYRNGKYEQCSNVIIEGGTWDANLAQYNRNKLGDTYQSSVSTFTHMKNLVVRNVTFKGNNLAHQIEIAGTRDVTIENCRFTGFNGYYASEAIQIEPLHSKGGTRESAPYDDTISKDVIVYQNTFDRVSRGVGNHTEIPGKESSQLYIFRNTFTKVASQAVLTCGCRNMRIEGNTMKYVGTGVDVRITWEDGPINFHRTLNNYPSYQDIVAAGLLNRKIAIVNNNITKLSPTLAAQMLINDPLESLGVGIYVKGQVLKRSQLETPLKKAAGSYVVSGVAIKGNTVKAAIGKGMQLKRTVGISLSSNTISGTKSSTGTGLLPGKSAAYALWTASSTAPVLKGNTISAKYGWGVYLSKSSAQAVIKNNVIQSLSGRPAIYINKASKPKLVANNQLEVTGKRAIKSPTINLKTPKITKKSKRGVSGTGSPKTVISAYANKRKLGRELTTASGQFTIKFNKKMKNKSTIRLQYSSTSNIITLVYVI